MSEKKQSEPAARPPDILTVHDLAIRWQVKSLHTVRRIASSLGVRSFLPGRRPRYRLIDVLTAEERSSR